MNLNTSAGGIRGGKLAEFAAQQQMSTTAAGEPASEIREQLDRLSAAVDVLASVQSSLSAKLTPVSLPPPPSAEAKSSEPSPLSPVGGELQYLRHRVNALADALAESLRLLAI